MNLDGSSWSTQLIFKTLETKIHSEKISKIVEDKKQLNQIFIYEKVYSQGSKNS